MRRYMKKEILSKIDFLEDIIDKIKLMSDKDNMVMLNNILGECQEIAINVGEIIENSEGEGTKTVTLLEMLCEIIYQCSVASGKQERYGRCKEMSRTLCEIKKSIRKNIPERKMQVVFMPYKASMWDSLESVWQAADKDEECEAYVVPIPYFDRNQDGSIGKMHDEKNEFPEDVPIVDWQNYDMEQEHPDVIFFHNPYDECNKVTSVHPSFYSSELKKYTDLLVYIPYFVCYGNVRAHYCTTPGVYNADKVIVQDEKVCDTYKKVFVETVLDYLDNESRAEKIRYKQELETIAEKKFLGLGSPKFDIVSLNNDKIYEIPLRWSELIGEGKSRKKIILLNFHISTIMYGREENFFGDIDRIFDVFRNNREVVLWWRPHPLMEATINSMNPEVRERYYDVVDRYCEEGWGIYDDTPDFNRAVNMADAYCGDKSSVVELFRRAGKPVMIIKHVAKV